MECQGLNLGQPHARPPHSLCYCSSFKVCFFLCVGQGLKRHLLVPYLLPHPPISIEAPWLAALVPVALCLQRFLFTPTKNRRRCLAFDSQETLLYLKIPPKYSRRCWGVCVWYQGQISKVFSGSTHHSWPLPFPGSFRLGA